MESKKGFDVNWAIITEAFCNAFKILYSKVSISRLNRGTKEVFMYYLMEEKAPEYEFRKYFEDVYYFIRFLDSTTLIYLDSKNISKGGEPDICDKFITVFQELMLAANIRRLRMNTTKVLLFYFGTLDDAIDFAVRDYCIDLKYLLDFFDVLENEYDQTDVCP